MTATAQEKFQIGDRLLHPGKPEWGVGTVASASATIHEGVPCQRLAIRFDRAGLKTITTALAPLRRANTTFDRLPAAETAPGAQPDPFAAPNPSGIPDDPKNARKLMTAIPEDAVDPFQTPAARLRSCLALYRFEPTPASLIDWAAAQSRLSDPLSRFSRHELEEYFADFRRNLDKALAKCVQDAGKVDPAELRTIAQAAPPAGQRALQALHRRR
jgi:hypothetical protein